MPESLSKSVEILIGAAIVALMIADVFQSVIVPRAVGRHGRPSSYVTRWLWHRFLRAASRIADPLKREAFLATYAPFALSFTLVFWIAMLIIGYGTIFYALRDELRPQPEFWSAVYFAGASLLTIGYGDVVPVGGLARLIALLAGASGFAVVAIVTSYLFAVFGSFQQREVFVTILSHCAGRPPSGAHLVAESSRSATIPGLAQVMRDGQIWTAQILGNHLAYPILPYFRSNGEHESWVATLGALLDTATLLVTTVEDGPRGAAELMLAIGQSAVLELSKYFGLSTSEAVGIERAEFDASYRRLTQSGLRCRTADEAWLRFSEIRMTYASRLNALARYFDIPPAQWVGDRSLL